MATIINGSDNFNTNDVSKEGAYANFVYAGADSYTICTTGYGTQTKFNFIYAQKNISGNISSNNWTHSATGVYSLTVRYRQATGGDVWSVWGVTKNGNSDCAGMSARTGSEDGHNEAYNIVYKVDSTSATYQLQGWSGATKTIANAGYSQGKPSWSNYSSIAGETDANGGRTMDISIYKIGEL